MKYILKDLGLEIVLDDNLLSELIKIGMQHFPKEIGGFLIGYYSNNNKTLYVTDTILPIKYKSTKDEFIRETEGIMDILTEFYNKEISKIYIGEWHTHPNSEPIPSLTDMASILKIEEQNIIKENNPILLIMGNLNKIVKTKIYTIINNKKHEYEIQNH